MEISLFFGQAKLLILTWTTQADGHRSSCKQTSNLTSGPMGAMAGLITTFSSRALDPCMPVFQAQRLYRSYLMFHTFDSILMALL